MFALFKINGYLLTIPLLLGLFAIPQKSLMSKELAKSCEAIQCSPFELPAKAIQKLKINAGFGWGIFSGRIYNGNHDYTITRLIVSMEPIHDHHTMEMIHGGHPKSHQYRIHQIDMNLQPLTHGAISAALDDDVAHVHNFRWKVLKAFGYKT